MNTYYKSFKNPREEQCTPHSFLPSLRWRKTVCPTLFSSVVIRRKRTVYPHTLLSLHRWQHHSNSVVLSYPVSSTNKIHDITRKLRQWKSLKAEALLGEQSHACAQVWHVLCYCKHSTKFHCLYHKLRQGMSEWVYSHTFQVNTFGY